MSDPQNSTSKKKKKNRNKKSKGLESQDTKVASSPVLEDDKPLQESQQTTSHPKKQRSNENNKKKDSDLKGYQDLHHKKRKSCSCFMHRANTFVSETLLAFAIILFFISTVLNTQDLLDEHIKNFASISSAFEQIIRSNDVVAAEIFIDRYSNHSKRLQDINFVKYPVIFVPGIISTRLELWKGKDCASPYFRSMIWASPTMVQMALLNKYCWLEHIALNQTDWSDPKNIKVRPSSGLASADYFLPGYWIWGKLISNLAHVGYDENSMFMIGDYHFHHWKM